ncbi:MAG: GNAT family N-acetyltransferase [Lachnospiraceae bacterium]|nr:GNAT family N-acetyltransferase [Lachnospiraceae bacterium]
MNIKIRKYTDADTESAIQIWNQVVEDGVAFPQIDELTAETGREFFQSQSYTGIAYDEETEKIVGLYILHPNNVGRCGHICNASYAVAKDIRGQHIGEKLVTHCIKTAKELKYRVLQFNAVVSTNAPALALYKKLGFVQLGVIPKGFLMKDGHYEDIIPHYYSL